LAPSFDKDEVFKLFGFAAQHKITVELFGTLGFADKASGMLVEKCFFFLSDTSYYTYFFLILNLKCWLDHVFIKCVNILGTLLRVELGSTQIIRWYHSLVQLPLDHPLLDHSDKTLHAQFSAEGCMLRVPH
jgi:hypothetical protein